MKKITLGMIALAMAFSFSFAEASSYSFQKDLTVGSSGSDVSALQSFLVSKGYLTMPTGVAYGYFGTLTQSAVARFQAANGITPVAGYFGPLTRATVNSTSDSSAPTNGGTSSNGGSSSDVLKGGDGDFKSFKLLGSPSNKSVDEDGKEQVLGFEFKADDSDLKVERLNVEVTGNGNTAKPYRYIDSLVLYNGDKKIATVDAGDKSDWDEKSDNHYQISFSKLSEIVKEDKTARFYVEVVTKDSINDSDLPLKFNISISDDGIRALNAEGINVYEGSDSQSKSFTIKTADAGNLTITVDEDDNKDKQVEVEENDQTEDVVLYTSEVKSKTGDNNVEKVRVSLGTTTGTTARLSDIINTLYLFIDGKEVASESVDGGATDSVTFDDLDEDIDHNDKVEFEVRAYINEQKDSYENGSGVKVTGMSVDFTDAQDDDHTASSNTAGGEITFSVDAVKVNVSKIPSAQSPVANDESKGRFFVEFKVTAPSDEALYIAKGATTSTDVASGQGVQFVVIDGNGVQTTATTTSSNNLLTKVSGGSVSGSYYKINSGQTATFRLDVIVENTGASEARTLGVQLTGINYKIGLTGADAQTFTSGLDEDYQSDTAYLLTSNTAN